MRVHDGYPVFFIVEIPDLDPDDQHLWSSLIVLRKSIVFSSYTGMPNCLCP